jgi:hypothetical protein
LCQPDHGLKGGTNRFVGRIAGGTKKTNAYDMNGELPFLNILFRGGFFQLADELVPHRSYHPVGKARITA